MAHVIRHAAGQYLQDITAEIEKGSAELYRFDDCFFCFRLEQYQQDKELVVIAAEGENLMKHCNAIIQKATALGCSAIRFHTSQQKLGRAMRRYNAQEVERVYKVVL